MKKSQKTLLALTTILISTLLISYSYSGAYAASNSKKKKAEIKKLLAKRNIIAIPSLTSQVTTVTSGFTISAANNPPVLQNIPTGSIKDLFWRKINGVNVVDLLNNGVATDEVCNEFFGGAEDRQSGGLGACRLAESVGFSYSTIVRSGGAFCYIQNLPQKENLNAAAITLQSGVFPDNDVTKLFSAPEGSASRIIKINVTGDQDGDRLKENTYVEVLSEEQNKTSGNIYNANLWYCGKQDKRVVGYDLISVSNSLNFSNQHVGINQFGFNRVLTSGKINIRKNKLVWDADKNRTASIANRQRDGDIFKSEILIKPNDTISVSRMDNFRKDLRKISILTEYSGNVAESLRFLTGAFNELEGTRSTASASDFNGVFYETDLNSKLLNTVLDADFTSGFFAQDLDVTVTDLELDQFSCDAVPAIEIQIDLQNTTLRSSVDSCIIPGLENMRFCNDNTEIKSAEENFKKLCLKPLPGLPKPGKPPK